MAKRKIKSQRHIKTQVDSRDFLIPLAAATIIMAILAMRYMKLNLNLTGQATQSTEVTQVNDLNAAKSDLDTNLTDTSGF